MKIYLSGPIAGRPDGNRRAFSMWREALEAQGHEVINPHDVNPTHDGPCRPGYATGSDGHSSTCHLPADVAALAQCDAMALLPRWQESRGVRFELEAARAFNIPVQPVHAS